jgi:hypothetical protein
MPALIEPLTAVACRTSAVTGPMTAATHPLTAPVGHWVSLARELPPATGCTSVVADAQVAFAGPLTVPVAYVRRLAASITKR